MTATIEPLTSTNMPAASSEGRLTDLVEHPAPAPATGIYRTITAVPNTGVASADPGAAVLPAGPAEQVAAVTAKARAGNTNRAYATDWARFTTWCQRRGLGPLPAAPQGVAAYLAEAATARTETGERAHAVNTLRRWVAAINAAHRACGHLAPGEHELVKATLAGIRREYAEAGERPVRRRTPLVLADVQAILDTARDRARSWSEQVAERRDAALILFGFAGAFRRSELVALTTDDVRFHPQDGLHVRVGKSKTDQEGEGQIKALPYGRSHETCPVCAYIRWRRVLDAWEDEGRVGVLKALRQTRGFDTHGCRETTSATGFTTAAGRRPVFRGVHKTGAISGMGLSGQAVNPLLRRRAAAAGLDPATLQLLGGHSLRAGFVTQAVRAGADAAAIMRQTGHSTEAMVRLYTRENAPLIGNAVTSLGL